MNNQQAIAQLRHAYKQLIEGVVKDQSQFAKGLIGPVIEHLEGSQTACEGLCYPNEPLRRHYHCG